MNLRELSCYQIFLGLTIALSVGLLISPLEKKMGFSIVVVYLTVYFVSVFIIRTLRIIADSLQTIAKLYEQAATENDESATSPETEDCAL